MGFEPMTSAKSPAVSHETSHLCVVVRLIGENELEPVPQMEILISLFHAVQKAAERNKGERGLVQDAPRFLSFFALPQPYWTPRGG